MARTPNKQNYIDEDGTFDRDRYESDMDDYGDIAYEEERDREMEEEEDEKEKII